MSNQAKAGGQYGVNGEFYQGGQFLPSNEETVKGAYSQKTSRPSKQEIAPYKWEISEKVSIWGAINLACKFHKTGYSKENGAEGLLEVVIKNQTPEAMEFFENLATRWNNGERWI